MRLTAVICFLFVSAYSSMTLAIPLTIDDFSQAFGGEFGNRLVDRTPGDGGISAITANVGNSGVNRTVTVDSIAGYNNAAIGNGIAFNSGGASQADFRLLYDFTTNNLDLTNGSLALDFSFIEFGSVAERFTVRLTDSNNVSEQQNLTDEFNEQLGLFTVAELLQSPELLVNFQPRAGTFATDLSTFNVALNDIRSLQIDFRFSLSSDNALDAVRVANVVAATEPSSLALGLLACLGFLRLRKNKPHPKQSVGRLV